MVAILWNPGLVSEVTLEVGRQDLKNFGVLQMIKPYAQEQNSGPVKYHQCKGEKMLLKIDLSSKTS